MGLSWLDWIVLGIFFASVLFLGLLARRLIKSRGDFFLGGRRFNGVMLAFLSFGSGTHTDQAVIVSGASYRFGFSGAWVELMWLFVTPFYWLIAPIYRRARCYTSSDIYERRFGQSVAGLYTLMGVFTQALIMGMMLKAFSRTFTGITGGSADIVIPLLGGHQFVVTTGNAAIAVCTVLFVTYGVMGGLIAAVWTDVLQGILTIAFSFLMIPFALARLGGLSGLHAKLADPARMALISGGGLGLFFIIMTVINGIINNAGQPGTIMGFAAGRTEVEGRVGKVYGNMLKRFCIVGWGLLGVIAAVIYPNIHPEEIFGHAIRNLLPAGLVGVMLAAAMAAMMSVCNICMVTASSLFTQNFWKRYIFPGASEHHCVTVTRIMSVVAVAGGLTIAYTMPSLLEALTWLWAWPTFMGIIFWLGIFSRRANTWGAWASFLASSGIYLCCKLIQDGAAIRAFLATAFGKFMLYPLHLKFITGMKDMQLAPWIMLYYLVWGTVAGVVVSYFTRPPDKRKMDDFFLIISTPIGEEEKLKKANVAIMYK